MHFLQRSLFGFALLLLCSYEVASVEQKSAVRRNHLRFQSSTRNLSSVKSLDTSWTKHYSCITDRWKGWFHIELFVEQRWSIHLTFFQAGMLSTVQRKESLPVIYRANNLVQTAIILHHMFHIVFVPHLNLTAMVYPTRMYTDSLFLVGGFSYWYRTPFLSSWLSECLLREIFRLHVFWHEFEVYFNLARQTRSNWNLGYKSCIVVPVSFSIAKYWGYILSIIERSMICAWSDYDEAIFSFNDPVKW